MCAIRRILALLIVASVVLYGGQKANAQIVTSMENLTVTQNFATSSSFGNSTVWLGAYNINPNLSSAASGVVVRNDASGVVIITAGHFSVNSQQAGFTEFKATTRPNIYQNTAPLISATSYGTHPGYGGSFGSGVDLGYVTLPAGSMPGITPAVLSTTTLTAGTHVYLGGYGRPAVTGMPPEQLNYDGIKRIGENRIDFITDGYANTSMFGPSLAMRLNLTNGSSGGGVFQDDHTLAALASWSTTDYTNSFSLVLQPHISYINNINPVPEPGSMLLVAAAGLAVGSRFVRRRGKAMAR